MSIELKQKELEEIIENCKRLVAEIKEDNRVIIQLTNSINANTKLILEELNK